MAWCHQATSHYLSQCWTKSIWPYGVTRPWCVKLWGKPRDWLLCPLENQYWRSLNGQTVDHCKCLWKFGGISLIITWPLMFSHVNGNDIVLNCIYEFQQSPVQISSTLSVENQGLGLLRNFQIKSMLNVQTCLQIGWLHSRQPIKSHVRH